MDNDLKKKVLDLAKLDRLAAEEKLPAGNIAGRIEVNEDIEDKVDLLVKLKRRYKYWRNVFILGSVVMIVILLYVIYTEVRGSREPAIIAPVPLKQTIEGVEYCLGDMLPLRADLDCSQLETASLGFFVEKLGGAEFVSINNQDYYRVGDTFMQSTGVLDMGLTCTSYESLKETFDKLPRRYTLVSNLTEKGYRQADVLCGVIQCSDGSYYTVYTRGMADEPCIIHAGSDTREDLTEEDTILQRTVYAEQDVCVINGDDFAYDEVGRRVLDIFNRHSTLALEDEGGIAACEEISDTLGGVVYDAEQGVYVTADGTVPEKVITVNIKYSQTQFNPLALAYYYGWY